MPKVKMGQIKYENVKRVFRRTLDSRTESWLSKIEFSESEMLEILDLSENVEYHRDKRYFYQRLIRSQKKFSGKVFAAYVDKLFEADALLNLGENSEGVSEYSKIKFIDYTLVTSANWFVFNYYSKNNGNPVGLDVTAQPYNVTYANDITRYMDKSGRGNTPKEYFEELNRIFDTFSKNDFDVWFDETQTLYQSKVVDIIMSYNKMPRYLIDQYFNRKNKPDYDLRLRLATHPNASNDIKMWAYEETKDEIYLPSEVKDIFVF